MDRYNILPLLGLALRGGNLTVGEEPVEAVSRARDARLLLLASDAAENTRRRVEHFAQAGQCLWLRLPFTKAELGRAVGRTSAAVAAVTDTGLAGALAKKLAALDPARYGETARRLELKARRRAERQARNGAVRPKRTAKTTEAPAGKRPGPPPRRREAAEAGPRRRSDTQGGPGTRRPVRKGKGSFRRREGRSQ